MSVPPASCDGPIETDGESATSRGCRDQLNMLRVAKSPACRSLGSCGRCNAAAVDAGWWQVARSGPAGVGPQVREVFWQARMAGAVVVDASAAAGIYERTGKA